MIWIINILIAVIKIYKNTYKDATSKSILGLAEPKAVSIFGFLQNFTSEFRNDVSATIHAHCNKLRELGQNSAYILDDTFRGGLRVRSTRPQLVITTGDNSLRIINTVRTEHDLAFEAPLYYLLHVYVSPDIQNVIITDPLPHYKNVRSIMREGRIFGDVVSYVRDIKYGNIGRINAEIQNLSPLITSVSATRLIEELGKQFGRDYSRIFSISMSNASVLIDPRGRGYKIVLNTYNGMDFDEEVDGDNTNPETLYNVELILERPLLTRMYATISKIFIPETSPIFLHVRGLFLESREVIDLNPMDYIEIQDWIAMHDPIIVMWSNSVVKQIPSEHERMTTRTVFQLIINGEQHNLFPERGYRKILFLLTNTTGTVSSANFSFVLREFKNKRIAFLLTDTMVTINRVYATGVEADFNLESQFQTLLTSYMDSRVPITLLDTTSPGITFSRVPNKDKWIFLMTQYNEPDVVLTGMDDYLQPSRNYRICSPFMWAYGIDGKTVEVNQEENEFETLARDHDDIRPHKR
nr:MAG: hypothetical protein [Planococcus ficus-associated reovirus 1]